MSEPTISKKMSAAAFFNENRAIAGFGNSMRAVFTSIRELVENGLDAAEKRGVNPEIYVELRKLSSDEINQLLDVKQHRTLEKHLDFLQLTCRDNGVGVPGSLIPELFGRVLTGTKYGVIQTRGRFGLGAKMCLLYAMSSVDLPAKIRSRYFMDDVTYEVHLLIDLERNEPIIVESHEYLEDDPNYMHEPGTEITITFTGAWSLAKNNVKEYFKQLAIITPYASFHVKLPGDKEEVEEYYFERVVDDMPPPPEHVKIHPWGCDITQFKAELASTKASTLKEFLATHFMGVTEEVAEDFFQLLEIDPQKSPKDLTSQEIRRIVHEGFVKAYQEAKEVKRKRDRVFQFDPPKGSALSPLGAARLKKGLEKELHPQFVEAVSRPPKAYSGHPFIVEAAIGYGGGVSNYISGRGGLTDNKIIYRYANRIPLIFGAGNDVITHVVSSIKWNEYGLTKQSDPLAIAVSVVSTKIPFPETSKEYISSVPEIEEEIRLALMQLGRRLKTFISRTKRRKREHVRLSRFVRSAPNVASNLIQILQDEKISVGDLQNESLRLAASLAHGSKRFLRLFKPLGQRLFSQNVWCPPSIQKALEDNGISTVGTFLFTPSEVLESILSKNTLEITSIKDRTMFEFDRGGSTPELDSKIIVSRQIEKRFQSKRGQQKIPPLRDALARRWIQNAYHYLATEPYRLRMVANLLDKLFESKKFELLKQAAKDENKTPDLTHHLNSEEAMIQSLTSIEDLKLHMLFPTFLQLKAKLPAIFGSFSSVEEAIFHLKHPNSTQYNPELTEFLVTYIKKMFQAIADKFSNFLQVNVTRMQPDWIDGYTKNAFHRRKIATVSDFLSTPNSDLVNIKELERSLYMTLIELLSNNSPSLPIEKIKLSEFSLPYSDVKAVTMELKTNGITKLSQLIALSPNTIYQERFTAFVNFLLEESKYKLLLHLINENKDYDLTHLKVIPQKLEKNLYKNQIFTTTEFLVCPALKLNKHGLPIKEVYRIKKELGTPLASWAKRLKSASGAKISVTEEVMYNSDKDFKFTPEEKKLFTDYQLFLRVPIILALPELRKHSHKLYEVGINCIGRFLVWTKSELAEILDTSEEKVQRLKNSLLTKNLSQFKTKPLYSFKQIFLRRFPLLTQKFQSYDPSVVELFYIYLGELVPTNSGYWGEILKIQEIAQKDITELSRLNIKIRRASALKDLLLKLKARNITTIRQFLDLHPEIITSEFRKKSESQLLLGLYSAIKNQELTDNSSFAQQIVLVNEFDEFQRLLSLPITRVEGLELSDYEALKTQGIVAIHQLYEYKVEELAKYLNKPVSTVEEILTNISIEEEGPKFFIKDEKDKYKSTIKFDFEDTERFSSEEIVSLILAGYNSVDQLFYLTNPYTFASPVVNWAVLDKFKKLLRSPLTLVTWEKEVKETVTDDETGETKEVTKIEKTSLSTQQLNNLRSNGITRIIDLLISKDETLSKILDIEVEEAHNLKQNFRIRDVGVELSDMEIFKPDIVKLLEEYDIITIEDLYFSTTRAKWKIKELDWESVALLKEVLNLPLFHLSDMLDKEIIEALNRANVFTLLGFLLSSPEALMNQTGIPDERFENIRNGLDISDIYYYFSLPIYFVPGLTFKETELLQEKGIETIIHFTLSSATKIKKILDRPTKEIKEIQKQLTVQQIRDVHEERGIFASETRLFDRTEQRVLAKESIFEFEGFQTIQEIFYRCKPYHYPQNPEIQEKIKVLPKILSLPIKTIIDISEYSLNVLESNDIHHLYQLLFIPDSDLKEPLLYRTVSSYSSKLLNLKAFHYLAKLPATVYNQRFFESIIGDLEDKNLLDVITDEKVINHILAQERNYIMKNFNLNLIRSVLELPLKITPFFDNLPSNLQDEYKDLKVGDVFDYTDSEIAPLSSLSQQLTQANSLNALISHLALPIVTIGIPISLALRLSKTPIRTLIDFYSASTRDLAELTGASMKQINECKTAMSFKKVIDAHSKNSHAFRPSSFISEEQINSLKEKGINDIETLYFSGDILGAAEIMTSEVYLKIKELLSGSIRFVGFLSFEEITRLEEFASLKSVIDLSLLSKEELYNITQNVVYKEFHVLDLISLDDLFERRKHSAIPLSVCKTIDEQYREKLSEIGIHSVQDFISRMTEIRETHPHLVRLDVFTEMNSYLASVVFLDLPLKQKLKLIYSGVGDILTFCTEEPSTISLILKVEESEIENYIHNLSPATLQEKISAGAVKLDAFSSFAKSKARNLMKSNKETVQDLYSFYFQVRKIPEVKEDFIEEFLHYCHASIYRIQELTPNSLILLRNAGLLRVIDLLMSSETELKEIFGAKLPSDVRKVLKGEFKLSKGTTFELPKPMMELITELGFSPTPTVEDIFAFSPLIMLRFSEAERIELSPNVGLLEQLLSFLCLNILVLPHFTHETKEELWKNNIRNVIDIISLASGHIYNLSSSTKSEIRSFKRNFSLTKCMAEVFSPYANDEFFLPKQYRDDFMPYGLNHPLLLFEFLNHSIFNLRKEAVELINKITTNYFKPVSWLEKVNSDISKIITLCSNYQTYNIISLLQIISQASRTRLATEDYPPNLEEIIHSHILSIEPPEWEIKIKLNQLCISSKKTSKLSNKYEYLSEYLTLTSPYIQEEIPQELLKSLLILRSLPVSLLQHLPRDKTLALKSKGITTVFDYLFTPLPLLSSILPDSINSITEFRKNFNISIFYDSISNRGLLLEEIPKLSTERITELNNSGIYTLDQLLENSKLFSSLKSDEKECIQKWIGKIYTPISLIAKVVKLSQKDLISLIEKGVFTYRHLLYIPEKELPKKLSQFLAKISNIQELDDFLTKAISLKENLPITIINITKSVLTNLETFGFNTIDHLYFTPFDEIPIFGTRYLEKLKDYKDMLSQSITCLTSLSKEHIIELYNKRYYRVIDILLNHNDLSSNLQQLSLENIKSLSSCEDYTRFSEPYSSFEKMLIEHRYNSLKEVALDPEIMQKGEIAHEILPLLNADLSAIKKPADVISKLQKSGIRTIADLVIIHPKTIASSSRISFKTIVGLLQKLKIDKIKQFVEERKAKIKTKIEFLPENYQHELIEMGLDINDLLSYQDYYPWLVDTKKLSKIREQISKLFEIPIVYLPTFYSKSIQHIIEEYYSQGIYSLKELMTISNPKVKADLESYISNQQDIQSILANYIQCTDFLKELPIETFFAEKPTITVKTLSDLIHLVLISKNLTQEGNKLKELFVTPILVLKAFNPEEKMSLIKNEVYLIGDLFTKPLDYWENATFSSMKTKLVNFVKKATFGELIPIVEDRLAISHLKLFKQDVSQFIQKEFNYVDELLLFILTKLDHHGATSKWRTIKKVFDTPMILVAPPKITMKNWKKLISNVRTLLDLYLHTDKELAKLISIDVKEIIAYKTNITYENIVSPPKIRPNIVFSAEDVKEFNEKGIKYWTDVVSNIIPQDLSKVLNLKLSFIHSLSLSEIEPLLKEEVTFSDLLFAVKYIAQLDIGKDLISILQAWNKFFSNKGTTLSLALGGDDSEISIANQITLEWLTIVYTYYPSIYKKLLKLLPNEMKNLIENLVSYLKRSPLLLSEISSQIKQELIQLNLLTLKDIILRRPELCTKPKLLKQLQRLISKITLHTLQEWEKNLTAIPEQLLTEKELATLTKAGIKSLEEIDFYSECLDKLPVSIKKIVNKLIKVLKSSVFVLPEILYSPQLFKHLLSKRISSIYDLMLAFSTDDYLQTELKEPLHSVLSNLDELKSKESQRLSDFIDVEEYVPILKKANIHSIGELVYYALASPSNPEIPEMVTIRALLLLPLSYLSFTKKLVTKLEKAGLLLAADFLLLPVIDEKIKIDLSESEVNVLKETKKTLKLSFLLEILNNRGYPVAKANFIDAKLRNELVKTGFTNIIHLLLPVNIISSLSSLRESQVKKLLETLNTPIYLITELVRTNLDGVRRLWDNSLYRLLDLLIHDFAEATKIAHIPLRQWKSILNTLSVQSLTIGKKELIPLKETIPYLTKTDISELSKTKISTLQHLIMPTKSDLRKKVYKLPNVQKLMKLVDSPIEQLDLEEKSISLLKNIGIKKISDFILYPAAFLEGPLELSYVKIKRIKQTLPKRKIVTPAKKAPATSKKASVTSRKKTSSSGKKTSSIKSTQKTSTKARTSASTKTRKTSSAKRTTKSTKKSSSQTQKTQKPRSQSSRSKTSSAKRTRKKKGD